MKECFSPENEPNPAPDAIEKALDNHRITNKREREVQLGE